MSTTLRPNGHREGIGLNFRSFATPIEDPEGDDDVSEAGEDPIVEGVTSRYSLKAMKVSETTIEAMRVT
jgi:hypothetical protein